MQQNHYEAERDVNQTQLTTTYAHPQTRSNQAIKHPCDWTIGAEPLTALEIEIDVLLGMFVIVIATCWQDGTWVQHVETRVDNVFGASPHNQEVRVSQPAAVSSLLKEWHSLESDASNYTPTPLCYMTGVFFFFSQNDGMFCSVWMNRSGIHLLGTTNMQTNISRNPSNSCGDCYFWSKVVVWLVRCWLVCYSLSLKGYTLQYPCHARVSLWRASGLLFPRSKLNFYVLQCRAVRWYYIML